MAIKECQTACPTLWKSNSNNILSRIVNAKIKRFHYLTVVCTLAWPTRGKLEVSGTIQKYALDQGASRGQMRSNRKTVGFT